MQAILDGGQGFVSGPEGNPLALVVNPRPYKGAHFAVFPPTLVEPCIRAGAPEQGCCPTCGAAWKRVVERTGGTWAARKAAGYPIEIKGQSTALAAQAGVHLGSSESHTRGWEPCCACPSHNPVPCTVLDPFGGSGTTMATALALGRRALSIEIAPDYEAMTDARIESIAQLLSGGGE